MSSPIMAALLSCQTTELTEAEKRLFSKSNPLGVTLFARNIQNKAQTQNLIKQIKETIGRSDVLIAVDQEGGRVRRLKEPYFRSYSAQAEIGSMPMEKAALACKLHAQLIGADLLELGINVNFAPVLDTNHSFTSSALKSRCFSNNPQINGTLGKIMMEAYMELGVLPCIKHMPGHGLAISDPHLNLPVIDMPLEQFLSEMQPFQTCKASPLGMTAHILLPQIDALAPLTQSAKGIQFLIREQIGFQGFLISDAIDMKALSGNVSEKASKSLDAGCDAVCYCMGNIEEMEALVQTCPELSDASLERLDKAIQIMHNKKELNDTHLMAAQYQSLMENITPYAEDYDATEVLHQLSKRN